MTDATTTFDKTDLTLTQIFLRRWNTVVIPSRFAAPQPQPAITAAPHALRSLDLDLLDLGYTASAALTAAFANLPVEDVAALGNQLLADLAVLRGSHRPHAPLFAGFPDDVPADTFDLWVRRLIAFLAQAPEQPCVLCGKEDTVVVLRGCGDLVCTSCFTPERYSGCPVCNRRTSGPYEIKPQSAVRRSPLGIDKLTLLGVRFGVRDAARELAGTLLSRTAALSPADRDDLAVLIGFLGVEDLSWLPQEIPARETRAQVLAHLATQDGVDVAALFAAHANTATDLARTLVVLCGGDVGLTEPFRLTKLSRPARRAVVATLNGLNISYVVEDMLRHQGVWKKLARALHPYEYGRAYPNTALAFAVLQRTKLSRNTLGELIRMLAETYDDFAVVDGRAVCSTWGAQVEGALAAGDVPTALRLLQARPGQLVRRLDHLLRLSEAPEQVIAAVRSAAGSVAPAVLMSAYGHLGTRADTQKVRAFFPKGASSFPQTSPNGLPGLGAETVAAARAALAGHLFDRAAQASRYDVAVLDRTLTGVVAPFGARNASAALVEMPRGSALPLPDAQVVRLFLHWVEPDYKRVDLDLSAIFLDANGTQIGYCDYTNMRWKDAATHSGDLTSAPAPHGATEFIDLDVAALRRAGVARIIPVVFSYNNVAFDELPVAFAGFMARDETEGRHFDPGTVEQKFTLTGKSKTHVPLTADLTAGTMRWLDVNVRTEDGFHDVRRHGAELGSLVSQLEEYFASGARASVLDLALWNAAARTDVVFVRESDGTMTRYVKADGMDAATFADAIRNGAGEQAHAADLAGFVEDPQRTVFLAVLRGDLPVAAAGTAYAMYPGALADSGLRLVAATDLMTDLAA